MPYIGRSTDGFGVRNRFIYTVDASDTSVSGSDANGATLTFTDGAYVDVYLNGVLLKAGTDYNTNTANTIAGISSMAANDEVTVVVYDVFTVGDMVSATSGGTFSGNVTVSSADAGSSADPTLTLYRSSASPADADFGGEITFKGRNDNSQDVEYARIVSKMTDVSDGTEDGNVEFHVISNGSESSRILLKGNGSTAFKNADVSIDDSKSLTITDGDLVIGTSGHGIDFSATADGSSASFSELFDDYEEGVFGTSVTLETSGSITLNGSYNNMRYTKVGRLVTINADMRISSVSSPQGGLKIAIPFATQNTGHSSTSSVVGSCITHGITKQTDQVGRFVVIAGSNQTFLNFMYETTTTRLGAQAQNLGLGANDEIVFTMTYTAA